MYEKKLLSAEERTILSTLRHPTRRLEWICGRILLKRMVWEESPIPRSWELFGQNLSSPLCQTFSQWTVCTRNSQNQGIPPRIFVKNRPLEAPFSLSHAAGYLAAIRFSQEISAGCDICPPKSFSPAMQRFFLHQDEKRLLAQRPPEIPEEIFWGGKEAAYKAHSIRHTEVFQPLDWNIRLVSHRWKAIHRSGICFSLEIRRNAPVFLILAREG